MGQTGGCGLSRPESRQGAVLELELKAFPRDRRVEWFLSARRLGGLDVGGRVAPPLWLPLGPHSNRGTATLTLACRTNRLSLRGDVLHDDDPVRSSLAVGKWRMKYAPLR